MLSIFKLGYRAYKNFTREQFWDLNFFQRHFHFIKLIGSVKDLIYWKRLIKVNLSKYRKDSRNISSYCFDKVEALLE